MTSEILIKKLKLHEAKPTFNRSFGFKVYPFFTRNPERAKFQNGFNPILGAITRISQNKISKYMQQDYNTQNILENIDTITDKSGVTLSNEEKKDFIENLFNYNHLTTFKHPYLLNYFPLSDGSENTGEVAIADYICEIFQLKHNQKWQSFIADDSVSNLVEKLLIENIPELEDENKKSKFIHILDGIFKERYEDLEYILTHKDFALKNLGLFFAFYYFQFVLQTVLWMDRFSSKDKEMIDLYYTLDTEKITSTRITNSRGFNKIRDRLKDILVNDNLLGYLNILIDEDSKLTFHEILDMDKIEINRLNVNLLEFLRAYKVRQNKNNELFNNLEDNIQLFKTWLKEDIEDATKSRFHQSIDEIGNFFFLKRRGQLGKTLTLKKETIILLTALSVKDEKKIISEVFEEFEKRGVFLDRYTKDEILTIYEKMNILDKKSDSGEAIYVKPIL